MAAAGTPCRYVVAIDIGSSRSGIALIIPNGGKSTNNVRVVGCCNHWNEPSGKTSTSLLLNDRKVLQGFGSSAEERYADPAEWKQENLLLFRKFKYRLLHEFKDQVTETSRVPSDDGQVETALTVYAEAFRCMRETFLETVKTRESSLEILDGEVKWVINVPLVWEGPAAKQMIEKAAVAANLVTQQDKSDRLIVLSEPEAAGFFCRLKLYEDPTNDSKSFKDMFPTEVPRVFTPNEKFLVVDCGGGTTDIAIQERKEDGSICHIFPCDGGIGGGQDVNEAFKKFLKQLLGTSAFAEVDKAVIESQIEMFETGKQTLRATSKEQNCFVLKAQVLAGLDRDTSATLEDKLAAYQLKQSKSTQGGGLEVEYATGFFKFTLQQRNELFSPTIDKIKNLVIKALTKLNQQNVALTKAFLVGGFSDCKLLAVEVEAVIKKWQPEAKVLTPFEPNLAVLKGAALYGAVQKRPCDRTYGIQISPQFDPKVHDKNRRKQKNKNLVVCAGVFCPIVEKGDVVTLNQAFTVTVAPHEKDKETFALTCYATDQPNVKYVDETGVEPFCIVEFRYADGGRTDLDKYVKVQFHFGFPEVWVTAKECVTGRKFYAKMTGLRNVEGQTNHVV